jgi:alpha-amylase
MLFLNIFTTILFYVTSIATAADTSAWKSRSIYFVLTDRIARSSSDAGGGSCSDLGNYCGGTFKGLESKLDYIKNLGFDAIWITPVVASTFGHRALHTRLLTDGQTRLVATTVTGPRTCTQSTQTMVLLPT